MILLDKILQVSWLVRMIDVQTCRRSGFASVYYRKQFHMKRRLGYPFTTILH